MEVAGCKRDQANLFHGSIRVLSGRLKCHVKSLQLYVTRKSPLPKVVQMSVRFIMIGGFLGAGKTTSLGRLARMYVAEGKRVGIVTNDQAHDLVDTNTFRSQGLAVEEVPGACFCCRFDDLVSRVGSLESSSGSRYHR